MKLRLFENNIRLRLTQAEVQSLAQGTAVQASTRFFSGELRTQVQVSSAAKDVTATLVEGGRIQVDLPAADVARWAYSSEEEGLYGSNGVTNVAVEKDYACLHPTGAMNEGTFPNPSAGAKMD
jgi:hypothetical protein